MKNNERMANAAVNALEKIEEHGFTGCVIVENKESDFSEITINGNISNASIKTFVQNVINQDNQAFLDICEIIIDSTKDKIQKYMPLIRSIVDASSDVVSNMVEELESEEEEKPN